MRVSSLRILAVRLLEELTRELFRCNAAVALGVKAITNYTVVQQLQVETDEKASRDELLVVLILVFLVVRIDAIIIGVGVKKSSLLEIGSAAGNIVQTTPCQLL